METKTEPKQRVLDFIEKSTDPTAEIIANEIQMNKLQVFKLVKGLATEGLIKINSENNPPTYQYIADSPQSTKTPDKAQVKKVAAKTEEDEVILKSGGRDTTKLKFNGELYGKGRLVLAVVRKYVEDNPSTTITKLKEVFPDELQPRYGMVQEVGKAKKISVDRDRFFLKQEDLIKVGDKKIAVCNQFGSHNLPLKHFRSLGYSIK